MIAESSMSETPTPVWVRHRHLYGWDANTCMGETPTPVWVRHRHLYGWDTSTVVWSNTSRAWLSGNIQLNHPKGVCFYINKFLRNDWADWAEILIFNHRLSRLTDLFWLRICRIKRIFCFLGESPVRMVPQEPPRLSQFVKFVVVEINPWNRKSVVFITSESRVK